MTTFEEWWNRPDFLPKVLSRTAQDAWTRGFREAKRKAIFECNKWWNERGTQEFDFDILLNRIEALEP